MAREPLILAIDQGTSSSKALLVDRAGTVVARASATLSQRTPRPGWVEQSGDEIWSSVRTAVAGCLERAGEPAVAAVGISSQRESLLLWERAGGRALTPVISWQDRRTADVCTRLADDGYGKLVRERSGLPLDPMFSATKGSWLLDAVDPDRTRAARGELCLGTIDSWLLSRLGSEHCIEIGNAARTQLLDIRSRAWDPELLDLFAIPEAVLPRIVASTGPFGAVRDFAPLPDGTPVTAVLGDSHAALFAHAGWRPGQVKATYGTGSSVMGLCEPDRPGAEIDPGLCLTIAWQTDAPHYAVEGNIRSSGATLAWLADLFDRTPAQLAVIAEHSSSDGVHLVPAFNGLGAPWWDNRSQAVLSGMTLGTRLPQLARAALESIAFQVEDVVAAVHRSGSAVDVLLTDGGAAENPSLMQLQADLSGRTVHRSQGADLSALGAAHLAGLSAGYWTWSELQALPRPHDTFTPRLDPDRRTRAQDGWHTALRRARLQPSTTEE